MSNSPFLAAARSMDDFAFRQRITAAVLYQAQFLLSEPASNEQNYAIYSLLHPQELDPTMLALVATDAEIAGAVTVSSDGTAVDTSTVPDGLILGRVIAKWPLVASKYPTNPLAA